MKSTWDVDTPGDQEIGSQSDPIRHVSVTLISGRVDVVGRGGGGGGVRLQLHELEGRPLGVSVDGGHARVEHHKESQGQLLDSLKGLLTGGRRSARLTLSVPAGTKVSVTTMGADVLVGGVDGQVSVNTGSGAVDLSRLSGHVDVKTLGGAVEANAMTGELVVKTVAGGITVGASSFRSLRAATVSGAIAVDATTRSAVVTANTVSGDVTLRLPEGAGYDVTATSTSGHVVVDGQTLSGGKGGDKGGHRSNGDRGVAVKARSVSGDLVVLSGAVPSGGADRPVFDAGVGDVQDVRPSERRSATPDPRSANLESGATGAGSGPGSERPGPSPAAPGTGGVAGLGEVGGDAPTPIPAPGPSPDVPRAHDRPFDAGSFEESDRPDGP